jgi:hypothetical protein
LARATTKKVPWCLLILFFVQATLLGGVGFQGGTAPAKTGKKTCQITLDVCGKCAPSVAANGMEPASNPSAELDYYFPVSSVFPPSPATAVASAEPGETGKPPKS